VSNLRPLDTRVAKAELHFRQCGRCQQAFGYCHSREPGRQYCFDCSPLARREREQRARRGYRKSKEGREQHRDEESRRRERLRGVGDRRCAPEQGHVETRAMTAAYEAAVEEPVDARDDLQWVLVAWPEVLAAAERLLGAQLVCPCCWRWGRVTEVLELAEWRRREETS
jgi:hypothetical protein